MDKKNTSITTEHGKARRGFVKKSSAIAGISILPASNVWGTCNVSGVSGGSQHVNATCTVRHFSGGYWPSFWEHFCQATPSADNLAKLAHMISGVSTTDTFSSTHMNKTEYYYPKVRQVLYKHSIDLPAFGKNTPSLHLNVGDAMKRRTTIGAKKKHIAAVYINHLFGFATVEHHFSGNDGRHAFMEHIWGSYHEGNFWDTNETLKASYTSFAKISEESLKSILRSNGIPT